jgi:hypothetical protein
MAFKCPHCGAPYFSFGEVLQHGIRLSGDRAPLLCARCQRGSYISLRGRNAKLALAILVVAFIASFPSPLSDAILGSLQRPWTAIVRATIWAAAIWLSLGIFVYGAPLCALEVGRPLQPTFTLSWRLSRLAFMLILLFWMYVVWRGLANAP